MKSIVTILAVVASLSGCWGRRKPPEGFGYPSGEGGGTGGTPAQGELLEDDCSSSADCDGQPCVEVTPGGFKACVIAPIEATECTVPEDECCTTSDCAEGICVSSATFPWFGPGEPAPFNLCATDLCSVDADCSYEGEICAPAGTMGRPVRACVATRCKVSSECTEFGQGACLPVEEPCSGDILSLECVYPEGCRENEDCGDDAAPFGPGEYFCDAGACAKVLNGVQCE
ncbi:MAG: hypothetical protein HOW73_23915 [Polyangiaceae bacterium]|nr:hypothetical protein [Polyangiaceae bacterium]